MTIDEMRAIVGAGPEVSDAAVVAQYVDYTMQGGPVAPTVIVTADEVKEFCRIDDDLDDKTLEIMIAAAVEAALVVADDWDGSDPAPARLKLAVLTHVARTYSNREDGADMPPSAVRLLGPMRTLDV